MDRLEMLMKRLKQPLTNPSQTKPSPIEMSKQTRTKQWFIEREIMMTKQPMEFHKRKTRFTNEIQERLEYD